MNLWTLTLPVFAILESAALTEKNNKNSAVNFAQIFGILKVSGCEFADALCVYDYHLQSLSVEPHRARETDG